MQSPGDPEAVSRQLAAGRGFRRREGGPERQGARLCILERLGSDYYPFGPHGQRQDPREVPRHPGSGGNSNPPQGMDTGSYPPAAVPLQGDPGSIGLYVGSFVLVCCCGPIWMCLYPLAAGAAAATFASLLFFLNKIVPSSARPSEFASVLGAILFLGSVLVSIVLLYILSRWEHRLARSPLYRYPRHLLRLLLLGILAVWSITEQPPFLYRNRPEHVKIFLVAVVIWHLLLWKAAPLRRFWHGALRYSGLRPGDLV